MLRSADRCDRFADASFDVVVALDDALVRALQSLHRIDALLTERLGPGRAFALTPLEQRLRRASQIVHAQCERHPASAGARPEVVERVGADAIMRMQHVKALTLQQGRQMASHGGDAAPHGFGEIDAS